MRRIPAIFLIVHLVFTGLRAETATPVLTMKPDTKLARDRVELVEKPKGGAQMKGILTPNDPGFKAGPRLTDEELFAALDLELPALAIVKAAVARKDFVKARKEYGAYLRTRKGKFWEYDPHAIDRGVDFDQKAADSALAGNEFSNAIKYTFPGGKRDWYFSPAGKNGLPPNPEWLWGHNRMAWWPNLGRAYWATGNEVYARKWVEEMRSWVHQCPVIDLNYNSSGSPWRTIESGIRMYFSWPTMFRFLESPSVTDDDLALFAGSCLEHARHLIAHPSSANWLTMEMAGLYTVGVMFPEFKEATTWRTNAINKLYSQFTVQYLPDGAQIELSPHYHLVALKSMLLLPKLAKLTDRLAEFPADYTARAQVACDYALTLMTPDRSLPLFNDSCPDNMREFMSEASSFFPDRADYRFFASGGKEGAPPTWTSKPLPWAGYIVMRSGWETNANYLAFDAGQLGAGSHAHLDKLNLVFHAYGREVLFDSGGGYYEASKFRSYAVDTGSHNTVLVDGKPQRRNRLDPLQGRPKGPLDCGWISTSAYDYAFGVYDDFYGTKKPAMHRRSVLFLKPDMAVVLDRMTPTDEVSHRYEARWHLFPTNIVQWGSAVVTAEPNQPNLAVVPLATDGLTVAAVSGQVEPELLGWFVCRNNEMKYIKATRYVIVVREPESRCS